MACLIVCYTLITSVFQLYALQLLYGVAIAINSTVSGAFMGDITKKESRGSDMGRLEAIAGIGGALATMAAGFLASEFGINTIFYMVAGIVGVATFLILFLIREDR